MPQICSCGAQLVPDAVFCHKCGKPLREIPVDEPESTASVPVVTIEPAPPPVNFHNRAALRVAGLIAVVATLLTFLSPFSWLAAGFFSSLLYRRRTGRLLSIEAGLRLGWITGVIMFVIVMVLMTMFAAWISSGGLATLPPEVKNSLDPKIYEAMKNAANGPAIAKQLGLAFMLITMFSMAGGALGAKLGGRGQGPAV